jgi:hypothetical protein
MDLIEFRNFIQAQRKAQAKGKRRENFVGGQCYNSGNKRKGKLKWLK